MAHPGYADLILRLDLPPCPFRAAGFCEKQLELTRLQLRILRLRQLGELYNLSFLANALIDDDGIFSQFSVKITLMFLKRTPGYKNVIF